MKALEWLRLYVTHRKAQLRGYNCDVHNQMTKTWSLVSTHDQAKLRVIQRLIEEMDLQDGR